MTPLPHDTRVSFHLSPHDAPQPGRVIGTVFGGIGKTGQRIRPMQEIEDATGQRHTVPLDRVTPAQSGKEGEQ